MRRSENEKISSERGVARVIPFMPGCGGSRLTIADEGPSIRTGIAMAADLFSGFGERRTIPKGGAFFEANDSGRHLYIVERGTVDIFMEGSSEECPIASFGSGGSFLFDPTAFKNVCSTAKEASVAIAVSLDRLDQLAREGLELRLLLYWYQSFDLQGFVAACYPEWDFECALPE